MMDQSSIVESLRKLTEKVKPSDSDGAERLTLLSNVVAGSMNAEAWAYSDIHTMIAPDSIVECYRSNLVIRGIDNIVTVAEILRNSLIFAPIIVTWYAISRATQAYSLFVQDAIQKKQSGLYSLPFLYLWQQHFFGKLDDPNLTLDRVAFADVGILLVILLLSLLAYSLSTISTARKEEETRSLRANLIHAITGAALYLHARPKLTAGDNLDLVARELNNMIYRVGGNFDTMVQNTTASFTKIARDHSTGMSKMMQDNAAAMSKMTQDTTARFGNMAKDITERFATALQQTRTHFDGITQEMNKQVQLGSEYLTKLGALTSGVTQLSTEVQVASNTLHKASSELASGVQRLITPVETMTQQQSLLLDGIKNAAELLQKSIAAVGDLATRQQKMSAELTDSLDELTLAVEKFDKLAKDQSALVVQHATFLQHLQAEHDKQGQLAVLLSDATIGVKNALSEMNGGAISMRSMAVDMNDLMRLQATIAASSAPTPQIATDIFTILKSYAQAAQVMESSGNELKTSAIAIQRASQQLRDILNDLPTQSKQNGHN